ncbi:hypothetical protein EDD17DRAFT_1512507 [Pisolithus thermaeus]|nr:hypothetical protein EV401DRAFT_1888069 [Pisolithus croceorrhizus]KAI6156317.1 hypothetical protein EDD17DRAFT_1512507 [Pisolithus thermaeus]
MNPTGPGSPSIAMIQQWTGDFFKDSALHMTSLLLHLGHDGAPCPSASMNAQATTSKHTQPVGMDEGEWEDIDYIPLHLCPPVGSKYLTVIDVTGVHFVLVQACQCVNAESYHMQLFCAKLYPSTFERPSMAFTFLVLDDFLRDNVECGTSGPVKTGHYWASELPQQPTRCQYDCVCIKYGFGQLHKVPHVTWQQLFTSASSEDEHQHMYTARLLGDQITSLPPLISTKLKTILGYRQILMRQLVIHYLSQRTCMRLPPHLPHPTPLL